MSQAENVQYQKMINIKQKSTLKIRHIALYFLAYTCRSLLFIHWWHKQVTVRSLSQFTTGSVKSKHTNIIPTSLQQSIKIYSWCECHKVFPTEELAKSLNLSLLSFVPDESWHYDLGICPCRQGRKKSIDRITWSFSIFRQSADLILWAHNFAERRTWPTVATPDHRLVQ